MNNFTSSDREIIRFLFATRGLVDLYELHIAFALSPAQILDMLERLIAVGLAERQGAQARLTDEGRDWVLAARGDIFFNTESEVWRPSSEHLLVDAKDPLAPYLPDLGLLDRNFFRKMALGKDAEDGTP